MTLSGKLKNWHVNWDAVAKMCSEFEEYKMTVINWTKVIKGVDKMLIHLPTMKMNVTDMTLDVITDTGARFKRRFYASENFNFLKCRKRRGAKELVFVTRVDTQTREHLEFSTEQFLSLRAGSDKTANDVVHEWFGCALSEYIERCKTGDTVEPVAKTVAESVVQQAFDPYETMPDWGAWA